MSLGGIVSAAGILGRIGKWFSKGSKKWGWKFWAALGALVLTLLLMLFGWIHLRMIAEERRQRLQVEAALATEKENTKREAENTARWKLACENQERRANEAEKKWEESRCREFKIEKKWPDGRAEISTTKICDSSTLTLHQSEVESNVATPPLATPAKVVNIGKPWPKWNMGVNFGADPEDLSLAVGADLTYYIWEHGGVGIWGHYPLGVGLRLVYRK